MPKMPQMDLIAELKKRQVKPQVTDGAIEGIITGTHVLQICSQNSHKVKIYRKHFPDGMNWQELLATYYSIMSIFKNSKYIFHLSVSDLRNSPYRRGDGRRATPRQDNWDVFPSHRTLLYITPGLTLYDKTFSICTVIQKMTAKHTQQMLHTNRPPSSHTLTYTQSLENY